MFTIFFSWKLVNISLKNHARTLWKGIVELCVSLGSTAPLQVAATHPKVSLSGGYTKVFGATDLPSLSNWASLRVREVWVTQMQAGTDSHLCYCACSQHISRPWNVGSSGWCVDCCSHFRLHWSEAQDHWNSTEVLSIVYIGFCLC